MSLRRPNPIQLQRPAGVECFLEPSAVKAWSRGVTAAADQAVIRILDVIGPDWWTGGGITTQWVTEQLAAIGDKPVTVQINSPGGDYFEGLGIYNVLAQHPQQVTVEILALAASAASVIAMAGDEIRMAKAAMMMIHNTQWVAIGDRHLMRETADIMQKFDAVAADLYADRSGVTPERAAEMMDAETWLSGKDAVADGFADGLMASEPKKDSDAKASMFHRVEAALTGHLPRSQVRAMMRGLREEIGITPGADPEAKPSAGDTPDPQAFVAELRSFQVR